jgi:hypothetical protein
MEQGVDNPIIKNSPAQFEVSEVNENNTVAQQPLGLG